MAVLNPNYPTWLDVARRTEDKTIAKIVEITAARSPMIRDAAVIEGNLTTGHKTTQRTGLPTAAWRMLNQGVPQAKSTTQQVIDSVGMLETYAEVDKALADLNGMSAQFMASEDVAFLEAMTQQVEQTLLAGDTTLNPERFMGLVPRYGVSGTNPLIASYNVMRHDDTGTNLANSSIWLITWGPMTTHMIYPKGSKAGWSRQFLGQQTKVEFTAAGADTGRQYEILRTHYKWDCGLTVRDWRANIRIANIDTNFVAGVTFAVTLEETLIRAIHRLRRPGIASGQTVAYMSEAVAAYLDIRAQAKTNVHLTHGQWMGEDVLMLRGGIPIRVSDAITNGEGVIS